MALLQRRQRADHAPLCSGAVVDRRRAEGRRMLRTAGQRHHRAIGLQQRIEARLLAQRTGLAERPHRTIDQPRVDRAQHVRPDAARSDHAGAQVLDQDVRILDKLFEPRDIVRVLDVQSHRALVAVVGVKQQRVAVDEGRAPVPGIVAAVVLLDLDHFGAHIAEDHTGHWPGDRLRDLDHFDAGERSTHCGLRFRVMSVGAHCFRGARQIASVWQERSVQW